MKKRGSERRTLEIALGFAGGLSLRGRFRQAPGAGLSSDLPYAFSIGNVRARGDWGCVISCYRIYDSKFREQSGQPSIILTPEEQEKYLQLNPDEEQRVHEEWFADLQRTCRQARKDMVAFGRAIVQVYS